MKYLTLIALGLVSVADAAYDFDGDGVDDYVVEDEEEECTGMACRQEANEDNWMDEDMYEDDTYEDWDFEDFESQKVFKMLAAMNANKTSDADGTDELGEFTVDLYHDGAFKHNVFYRDLSSDTESFVKGWQTRFDATSAEEYTFQSSDDCFLRISLEEIDTDSNSYCKIDVPCDDTQFSYAPCWIKGAYDTDTSDEYGHGYYMLTYSITEEYAMEDWGTCDVWAACQIVAFGVGIWCYEY